MFTLSDHIVRSGAHRLLSGIDLSGYVNVDDHAKLDIARAVRAEGAGVVIFKGYAM